MLQIYPFLLQKSCQTLAITATPWQMHQICPHFEKAVAQSFTRIFYRTCAHGTAVPTT
jgi:hypothetical protein